MFAFLGTGHQRRRRRALGAAAIASVLSLLAAGCAPRSVAGGEPDRPSGSVAGTDAVGSRRTAAVAQDAAADALRWECELVSGNDPADWSDASREWAVQGGSMFSSHRTAEDGSGYPGRPARDGAEAAAVEAAARAALDLLEQRGVSFCERRRAEIARGAAEAVAGGLEIPFPRIRIAGEAWERCVSSSDPDTLWRADLLVEYPIGYLRGDANNVLWERRRAAREAAVLISSAEDHLEQGRLFEGLLDSERAVGVMRATGVRDKDGDAPGVASSGGDPTDRRASGGDTPGGGAREIDEALDYVLSWSAIVDRSLESLTVEPTKSVEVVDVGPSADAVVEFTCVYEWKGKLVPAVGVPVEFELPGAGAVLRPEPLTDALGVGRCVIAATYGQPGEYELRAGIDGDVLASALASAGGPDGAGPLRVGNARPRSRSSVRVYLVEGAHAVSVCTQFDGAAAADAAQARAGFERRMERAGYRLGACGPDVDVIVRGRLSLSTRAEDGVWTSEAVITAWAFDQRTASELGETMVTVTEASGEGKRDSEVLALKEAGRLLAVYFEERSLSPGE